MKEESTEKYRPLTEDEIDECDPLVINKITGEKFLMQRRCGYVELTPILEVSFQKLLEDYIGLGNTIFGKNVK